MAWSGCCLNCEEGGAGAPFNVVSAQYVHCESDNIVEVDIMYSLRVDFYVDNKIPSHSESFVTFSQKWWAELLRGGGESGRVPFVIVQDCCGQVTDWLG